MFFQRINSIVGILASFATIAGFAYGVHKDIIRLPIGKQDRFHCKEMPDLQKGGTVWTVMYDKYKDESKPWLKMVTTLGEDWTPKKRCEKIASKLDSYRKDGLIGLTYRADPRTPNQDVICAKTQKFPDQCHLVITLKPGADPYETLRDMSTALIGNEGIYQSSDGSTTYHFSPESPEIYLQHFLAEDGR